MSDCLEMELKRAEIMLEYSKNGLSELNGSTLTKSICDCENGHGEYTKWVRRLDAIKSVKTETICPVCAEINLDKVKQKIIQQKLEEKENHIKKIISWSGIPKRFESCSFDNYVPVNESAKRNLKVCKAYAEKWKERLKHGGGIVMVGLPGTGKNHLAISIMKHIITTHQDYALITSVNKIIRKFRSTWSKDSNESENDVIEEFSFPSLLVIDEVGVQYGSDSEKLIIFEIINNRYEAMLPTILISNETRKDLVNIVGERVIDRMKDGGGCELVFNWESYRARTN